MSLRLQRYLAEAGVASRRACEELIRAGRVTVNDKTAIVGDTIDPHEDIVALDGKLVQPEVKEYWLLNKPAGVLSAVLDSRGRPTVTEYIPTEARVFPVGRLDLDTTGLLLLTNDGLLTERLLHPRYHVEKEYVVTVRGRLSESDARRLRKGVQLEEGVTAPAKVTIVSHRKVDDGLVTALKVIICEGKKRQVKRMLSAVGHRVLSLHRSRFATLTDAGLAVGQARTLYSKELGQLRKMAGLT